jgi:hypothetical protein
VAMSTIVRYQTPNAVHKITAGAATTENVAARMLAAIAALMSVGMNVAAAPAVMVQAFGLAN